MNSGILSIVFLFGTGLVVFAAIIKTATIFNNLALIYSNQGAYAKAEPLYLGALAIYEKVLGPDHPTTATSLNNLALLYDNQGAYA